MQAPQTCPERNEELASQVDIRATLPSATLDWPFTGHRALGTRLSWVPALRDLMVLQRTQIYVNWCIHLLGLL